MTSENIVLGAILSGDYHSKISCIPVAHFTGENTRIFRAIKDLNRANRPVDIATVASEAKVNFSDLAELTESYIPSINVDKHFKEIHDAYEARSAKIRLKEALSKIEKGAEPNEILSGLRLEADHSRRLKKIYSAGDQINAYQQRMEDVKRGLFKTGIPNIDNLIRGVAPGEVLTFMGRAGTFKTAFLQSMLRNYSLTTSNAAVFFSMEMPVAAVTERFMQAMLAWSGFDVENTFIADKNTATDIAAKYVHELQNLFVIDSRASLDDIPQYVEIINSRGVSVGLIGIDYMGLIDSNIDREYERISEIARGCKILARNMNLPVVVLSQTNRTATDGSAEIFMHQGRGSGAIEEAADFVIGGFCETDDENSDIIFKILKNRKGPKNACFRIDLDKRTFRFSGNSDKWYPPRRNKNNEGGWSRA